MGEANRSLLIPVFMCARNNTLGPQWGATGTGAPGAVVSSLQNDLVQRT